MVSINCTTEDHLELDQLTEFQGGLKNRTDGDYAKIIVSIQKYGFSFPFFVWAHDGINHVLDGHGRLGALKKLKDQGEVIPPLPVVYVNCGNEENAKNLLLRLNSQYGQMTAESVMDFMAGLEFDPAELALPEGVIDFNLEEKEKVEDDDIPEPETELPAISKPGDIYQLGPHLLMCGDSTKEEDMQKLMDGNLAALVVTDPPYGVSIGSKNAVLNSVQKAGHCTTNIKGDTLAPEALYKILVQAFKNIREHGSADFCTYYVFSPQGGELGLMMMMMMMKDAGLPVRHMLIWVKNTATFSLGRLDYDYRHEPIFYTWADKHRFYAIGSNNTVVDDSTKIDKMSKEELQELAKRLLYPGPDSVIYEDKPRKCDLHPTMKPVKLFMRLIKNSSKEEDIVLDPFGGSGTTIIASQRLKRCARLMELDPHYCDVIRRRWTKWARENNLEPGEGALE